MQDAMVGGGRLKDPARAAHTRNTASTTPARSAARFWHWPCYIKTFSIDILG